MYDNRHTINENNRLSITRFLVSGHSCVGDREVNKRGRGRIPRWKRSCACGCAQTERHVVEINQSMGAYAGGRVTYPTLRHKVQECGGGGESQCKPLSHVEFLLAGSIDLLKPRTQWASQWPPPLKMDRVGFFGSVPCARIARVGVDGLCR